LIAALTAPERRRPQQLHYLGWYFSRWGGRHDV
jgi:hypothetical protein